MTNHPNRNSSHNTNKQLFEALLAYETNNNNPADGRRVIREERIRLTVAFQQKTKRAAVERALAAVRHSRSTQGVMQIVALRAKLAALPEADNLSRCVADARATLKAWTA